jgi:hypothetical protein
VDISLLEKENAELKASLMEARTKRLHLQQRVMERRCAQALDASMTTTSDVTTTPERNSEADATITGGSTTTVAESIFPVDSSTISNSSATSSDSIVARSTDSVSVTVIEAITISISVDSTNVS